MVFCGRDLDAVGGAPLVVRGRLEERPVEADGEMRGSWAVHDDRRLDPGRGRELGLADPEGASAVESVGVLPTCARARRVARLDAKPAGRPGAVDFSAKPRRLR